MEKKVCSLVLLYIKQGTLSNVSKLIPRQYIEMTLGIDHYITFVIKTLEALWFM